MYTEDQLLPISALQHLLFCERQCALIHVERLWAENRLTVEGKHLHQRADSPTHESRDGVRAVRSLAIRSLAFGIAGIADVVEFHPDRVVPIEYKRGKPKKDDSDRVQLCAQALCLEEMLGREIFSGALFYGRRKRRTEVALDAPLRRRTTQAIIRLREMVDARETPAAVREPKCDNCSLINLCLPAVTGSRRSASRFMARQLASHLRSDGPETDDVVPDE